MLNMDLKDVPFEKRLYMLKHYILFYYLGKQKGILKNLNSNFNKFCIIVLYIPGLLFSWKYKRKYKKAKRRKEN